MLASPRYAALCCPVKEHALEPPRRRVVPRAEAVSAFSLFRRLLNAAQCLVEPAVDLLAFRVLGMQLHSQAGAAGALTFVHVQPAPVVVRSRRAPLQAFACPPLRGSTPRWSRPVPTHQGGDVGGDGDPVAVMRARGLSRGMYDGRCCTSDR